MSNRSYIHMATTSPKKDPDVIDKNTAEPAGTAPYWHQIAALLAIFLTIWLIWRLWPVIGIAILALVLAVGLEPAVDQLERRGAPRFWSILSIYILIIVLVGGLGYLIGRVLVVQAGDLSVVLLDSLDQFQKATSEGSPFANFAPSADWLGAISIKAANIAGWVLQGAGAIFLIFVIGFYLLLDGKRLRETILRMVPQQHKRIAEALAQEWAYRLQGYLKGVALSGLIVGVLTGIGLAILGVPYALVFGTLTGFLEVIPFIGPLIAAIGPVGFSLTSGIDRALLVAGFFILVQQAEDKLIVPRIHSRTTGLHPLFVLLGTLVLGLLFGILGLLLAIPLIAMAQATVTCVVSCFYHVDGTEAWLANHQAKFNTKNKYSFQTAGMAEH